VRDWDCGCERGQRPAERARSVALDDQQVRRVGQPRAQRRGDLADMAVRVLLAGAAETLGGKVREPELRDLEPGVLAGEQQARRDPAIRQGSRDGRQFDCFGPGADDQPDVGETQPSP
jgi:hypothetical protein